MSHNALGDKKCGNVFQGIMFSCDSNLLHYSAIAEKDQVPCWNQCAGAGSKLEADARAVSGQATAHLSAMLKGV